MEVLKDEIIKEKMNWINLYQIKGNLDENLPINRYRINSYPTTLLLDENFKIIAKSENVSEFKTIILQKLKDILK